MTFKPKPAPRIETPGAEYDCVFFDRAKQEVARVKLSGNLPPETIILNGAVFIQSRRARLAEFHYRETVALVIQVKPPVRPGPTLLKGN